MFLHGPIVLDTNTVTSSILDNQVVHRLYVAARPQSRWSSSKYWMEVIILIPACCIRSTDMMCASVLMSPLASVITYTS
jgi:hypothetical protein